MAQLIPRQRLRLGVPSIFPGVIGVLRHRPRQLADFGSAGTAGAAGAGTVGQLGQWDRAGTVGQCPVYSIQHTVYSIQYTAYSIQYAV